jgi:two-component system nitrate/nitrite response regulator NarL
VLVADDHPLYREGVVRAIKARPDLELIGQAGDGREALAEARRLIPDVALLDVRMPGMDGPQVLGVLREEGSRTNVLFLSAHVDPETAYQAVAAGASGYLSKDSGADQICDAVEAVARGETVLASEVQAGLASQIKQRELPNQPALTARERQVLGLIASGHSAPEIADQIYLSPATVKTHLQSLYAKLGVSERAAAVAAAMRHGLID